MAPKQILETLKTNEINPTLYNVIEIFLEDILDNLNTYNVADKDMTSEGEYKLFDFCLAKSVEYMNTLDIQLTVKEVFYEFLFAYYKTIFFCQEKNYLGQMVNGDIQFYIPMTNIKTTEDLNSIVNVGILFKDSLNKY
jgi:hypothetical protein